MSTDFGKQLPMSQSYAQSSVSPGGNAADISCRAISDGMKCIVNKRYEFVKQIVFIPPFVDDAVFAINLSIKLGRVDSPAVVQIRAYHNQGLYFSRLNHGICCLFHSKPLKKAFVSCSAVKEIQNRQGTAVINSWTINCQIHFLTKDSAVDCFRDQAHITAPQTGINLRVTTSYLVVDRHAPSMRIL